MSKLIVILITALLAVTTLGCQNTAETVSAGAKLKLTDTLIAEGIVANAIITDSLTETESNMVVTAVNSYLRFRGKYFTEISIRNMTVEELYIDYNRLRQQYRIVYSVVGKHWDEYTPATQKELLFYNNQARAFDKLLKKAVLQNEKAIAANTLIQMGSLMFQILGK